jgi:hypothetical protein
VLAAYREQLNEESCKQFEVQCRMFERLGVREPRMRSLYFSSALQGAMLMVSTYPGRFPVEQIKKQIIDEYSRYPPAMIPHVTAKNENSGSESSSMKR